MVKFFLKGKQPNEEIQDMMLASLEFETLYGYVNEKRFQEASEYVKANWSDFSRLLLLILNLASQYHSGGVLKIILNRLRADKTIPQYHQKELVELVQALDRQVELLLGDKVTTDVFPWLTGNELDRQVAGNASSRIKLREGAKRLALQVAASQNL